MNRSIRDAGLSLAFLAIFLLALVAQPIAASPI